MITREQAIRYVENGTWSYIQFEDWFVENAKCSNVEPKLWFCEVMFMAHRTAYYSKMIQDLEEIDNGK